MGLYVCTADSLESMRTDVCMCVCVCTVFIQTRESVCVFVRVALIVSGSCDGCGGGGWLLLLTSTRLLQSLLVFVFFMTQSETTKTDKTNKRR